MTPHLSQPARFFYQLTSPHPSLSFSSSLPPLSTVPQLKTPKPLLPVSSFPSIHFSAASSTPQKLLKELADRKRALSPPKNSPPKKFILKPPIDDARLVERFLNSPHLSLKCFPLLNSCLPSTKLNNADRVWIEEYLLEAKQALGYPLEQSEGLPDDNPGKHFDVLLYLAFQHPFGEETKAQAQTRHVRCGHSRLWFLGQYVLELAFAEYFLQRYPRESPGPMRERVYAFLGKRYLPRWIKAASLQNLVFAAGSDMERMIRTEREPPVKSVFWALFGAIYLCFGMPEVYRVLFEAFGMDPEDGSCQPKLRRDMEDVDSVSVDFQGRQLNWQDVAFYKPPQDALFAHPRLFRACVPPGMHRFQGNIWDYDKKPIVMKTLGYPLPVNDRIPAMTQARNIELGLGLQDLVTAKIELLKRIDAPGRWLQEMHHHLLMNKFYGRYLREKHLHHLIRYGECA